MGLEEDHLMADERHQYRAQPEVSDLTLTVGTASGNRMPAQILDVSAGGIGLLFEEGADPGIAAGEVMYLHITYPYMREEIVAPGLVRHCHEEEGRLAYGIEFVDWLGLLSQLPVELAPLFNQRADPRIAPEPGHPIEVEVRGTNPWSPPIRGLLRDLSVRGLAVYLSADSSNELEEGSEVEVSLTLPGSTDPVEFGANVRHCENFGDRLCMGVFFEEARTGDFDEMQLQVARYLNQLHRRSKSKCSPPSKDKN